jgi:hypothetical protein
MLAPCFYEKHLGHGTSIIEPYIRITGSQRQAEWRGDSYTARLH